MNMSATEGLNVLLSKLTALLHLTLSDEVLPQKVSSSVVELISQFATVSHEIKSKQNEYEQREKKYVKCLNEMENMVVYQKKEITNFEKKLKKDTRDISVDASVSCQSCAIKDALIEALRHKEVESQEIIDELEGQIRKSKMFIQAQQIMISGLRSGEKQSFNPSQQSEQTNKADSSKWSSLFSDEVPVTTTHIPAISRPNIPSPLVTATSPTRPPLPPTTVTIPHRYRVDETHSDDDEDYLEDEDGTDPDNAAAVQEAFGGDFVGDEEEEGIERDESDSSSECYEFEGDEGESTEGDYAEGIGGFDADSPYYDELNEDQQTSADQDDAVYIQNKPETRNKQSTKNKECLPQQDPWKGDDEYHHHDEEEESRSLELSVDPSFSYSNSDNSNSIELMNHSIESTTSSLDGIPSHRRRQPQWEGLIDDGSVDDSFSLIQNFYEIK